MAEKKFRIKKEEAEKLLKHYNDLYYDTHRITAGIFAFTSWDAWYSLDELYISNYNLYKIGDINTIPSKRNVENYLMNLVDKGFIEMSNKEEECMDVYDHELEEVKDNVNHPSHYIFGKEIKGKGKIEVIEAIESWQLDFRLANVIKYVARAQHKGKTYEDLKKALWYIARYMKTMFPEEFEKDYESLVKTLEKL